MIHGVKFVLGKVGFAPALVSSASIMAGSVKTSSPKSRVETGNNPPPPYVADGHTGESERAPLDRRASNK